MDEPRAAKYGRFEGLRKAIEHSRISKKERNKYIITFMSELEDFSFEEVKIKDRGIRVDRELDAIDFPSENSPLVDARIFKEGVHHFFNVNTSYNFMRAFLFHYQNGRFRPSLDNIEIFHKFKTFFYFRFL